MHLDRIAALDGLDLGLERGGHDPRAVDLLVDHVRACLRTGRQLPDPRTFALPVLHLRRGYSRAGVAALVDLVGQWRTEDAVPRPPQDAPVAPAAVRRPAGLRWSPAQADWVRESRFTSLRRDGYSQQDVDDFLDRVLVAMAHGEPLPDIASVRFAAGTLRTGGYDIRQVDAFLDKLTTLRPLR
ncbi:DivIVA domain-containing protein [Dermacoccaceae bacterium W4C1]